MCWRLQPYVMVPATLCVGAYNPACWCLQPYVRGVQVLGCATGLRLFGSVAEDGGEDGDGGLRLTVLSTHSTYLGPATYSLPSLDEV